MLATMTLQEIVSKAGLLPVTTTPNIAIIDDDAGVRHSTGLLLETRNWKFSEFERADDFLKSTRVSDFNTLLVDVRIPVKSGIELYNELLATTKKNHIYMPPVVFFSGHGDIPMAVKLMQGGAADFLEKPVNHRTLLDTIANAIQQDALARDIYIAQYEIMEDIALLTYREREILSEMVNGQLSKQIGERLNISTKTVEGHRLRICQKFNTRTSMELAAKLRDIPSSAWEPEGKPPKPQARLKPLAPR